MKCLTTQEIGSLKKPDWLISTLRNRRTPEEEKQKARDDAAYLNLRLLEDLGLDIIYDGEARRAEMYEYVIRQIDGFEFCGWVRSFNNKYFRKARCIGKVGYRGAYYLDEYIYVKKHARKDVKIPVTGPYTLVDWSYNEFYRTKEEFLMDVAQKVIRPLLQDLAKEGASRIQIDEPAATTHPSEMKNLVEAFNKAVQGVEAKISIHICFSGNEYRALFPHALDMKVSQFTLEFANRDGWSLGISKDARRGYAALDFFKEYGYEGEIGLGVVDVHSDELEPPELIRDRILYAAKVLGDPSLLYVNPDCGLRTRSRSIAFEKLKRMLKGVEMARILLDG